MADPPLLCLRTGRPDSRAGSNSFVLVIKSPGVQNDYESAGRPVGPRKYMCGHYGVMRGTIMDVSIKLVIGRY